MKHCFLIVLLMVVSPAMPAKQSGFDLICHYFEILDIKLQNEEMSGQQKFEFINSRVIKGLSNSNPARETWDVVMYAVPDERYEMFQYTVNEVLGSGWKCDAMNKHIASVSQ